MDYNNMKWGYLTKEQKYEIVLNRAVIVQRNFDGDLDAYIHSLFNTINSLKRRVNKYERLK